jgi:NitT/TauT family transport system substrate-binding protein
MISVLQRDTNAHRTGWGLVMAIVLFETFRAIFYTPFYLAHALGAYEEEGLDVRLGTSPDLERVADHLGSGAADVCWGGPMRIMVNHDRDPDCGIVGFCEVVGRDPFFLVGREPRPDFQMADLAPRKLASVSEVPTPWMCLQDDLRRAGVDPGALDRVTDRTMAENEAALREGSVDVVQLFQPYVENLLRDGTGHIWYVAASRGQCSYTTFYTVRRMLEQRADEMHKMTRAIYRTQKWLHGQDATTLAAKVSGYFEGLPEDVLIAALARYYDVGVWGRNPILPRAGFERLRAAMLSGGLIQREIPYDDCVDTRFAEAVIREDPPSL